MRIHSIHHRVAPLAASIRNPLHVIDAAKECPGDCIHVVRVADDVEVAGPDATD